jgi:hypothetical protein
MAHFAELDEAGIVTQVVVVHNNELIVDGVESEAKGIDFLESLYGHRNWKQTSYNANMRYNYAGVGFAYDAERDAFIVPQPYPSWSLDEHCQWVPPVPMPEGPHAWDESALAWVPMIVPA